MWAEFSFDLVVVILTSYQLVSIMGFGPMDLWYNGIKIKTGIDLYTCTEKEKFGLVCWWVFNHFH